MKTNIIDGRPITRRWNFLARRARAYNHAYSDGAHQVDQCAAIRMSQLPSPPTTLEDSLYLPKVVLYERESRSAAFSSVFTCLDIQYNGS